MNGIILLERGEGRELLKKHCRAIGISVKVIEDLVKIELENVGRMRRRGMFEQFDEILEQASDTPSEK